VFLDDLNYKIMTTTVWHSSTIPEANQEIKDSKHSREDGEYNERLAQEQIKNLFCFIIIFLIIFDTLTVMSSVLALRFLFLCSIFS
jgi:hypothetical protein